MIVGAQGLHSISGILSSLSYIGSSYLPKEWKGYDTKIWIEIN